MNWKIDSSSSVRLLTFGWLLLVLLPLPTSHSPVGNGQKSSEVDEISTLPAFTYPTLQSIEEDAGHTPGPTASDMDIEFDTGKPEDEYASESLETTTSVTSSTSVVVKSGRHFGSRVRLTSPKSSSVAPVQNKIQPALKSRPTVPVITFNPTSYKRILKRRNKNGTISVTQNNVEEETTEEPGVTTTPPTTTSQKPFLQRRKYFFGLRTTRPPTTLPPTEDPETTETEIPATIPAPVLRNRKIKLPAIKVPSLPIKILSSTPGPEANVTHSWTDVNRGPLPPPPTFEPEDEVEFTSDPDGVYRFKFSSAVTFPSVFSSTRIFKEEFGVTGETYWEPDDTSEEDAVHTEDEATTSPNPPPDETSPRPTPSIQSSEDVFVKPLSPYRDYFGQSVLRQLQSQRPAQNQTSISISQVTVTVTVTKNGSLTHPQNSNAHAQEDYHQNFNTLDLLPTPVLPILPISPTILQSPTIKAKEANTSIAELESSNEPVSPSRTPSNTFETPLIAEREDEIGGKEKSSVLLSTPIPANETPIIPTPVLSSKEYKSVFYSTDQKPHYTSTTYSFTSSTEFSFSYPEDDDHHQYFHGLENHQDLQPDEPFGHHHYHRPNGNKHLIQPTPTLQYWDTLGLKTAHFNNTHPPQNEQHPNPIPPTLSPIQEEVIKPDPTVEVELPEDEKKPPIRTTHAPIESPTTTTTTTQPTRRESDDDSHVSDEDFEREESKPVNSYPPVPSFVEILLDMPPLKFCPSIKTFKEMITLIYKYNDREVKMEQIVLHGEPDCASMVPTRVKTANGKSLNSSPSTNRAIGSGKDDLTEKLNKTKFEHGFFPEIVDEPGSYPVYIYVIDHNGTYDQPLTESFVNFWNQTRIQDVIFASNIRKVEMISMNERGEVGEHLPSNKNTGVIVAITASSIAAVTLLIIGIFLLVMRHRQTQNNFAKRCTPVTLDDYSLDNISVFNSFRRKHRLRASKRSYTNAGFDDPNAPSRSLDPSGLATAVKEVGAIFDEFSRIPSVLPTLDDIPTGAESKNRYANVIPMPDTRVLLTFQDDQPNSDYINANFVQGANGATKGYIITQGPLEETIVDFWRMIWESQVRVIFMLTDFSEAGIPKCAEYYPRSETIECSQLHGDFQVTLEKRDFSENCITSFLVVKDMGRSLRRDVVHLWYHSWPEKGIPASPQTTLDFLLKSRKYTKEPTPVLVHCSPGTGRSGTLVACDIGIKQLETERKVDIPQIVKQLRHDRAGAVQTKEQYRHIYEVLQLFSSQFMSSSSSET